MDKKRKRTNLTVKQKLELIEKLESGVSVACVCEEYCVKKQTVSDIRKSKDKLIKFVLTCDVDAPDRPRKHMKMAQESSLEDALLKWYVYQCCCGINVQGADLKSAAKMLANHMKINFKASDGWFWRFCKRHGITSKRTYRGALSAPMLEIELFRQKLMKMIDDENILISQIYNVDETGLLWSSLPENIEAYSPEMLSKERISLLLSANADGSHRLMPVIVDKSYCPRVLKDCMDQLPVIYYNSKNAWFTLDIFHDWFCEHFVPEVKKYQIENLGIAPENVKALVLLDNAPIHPFESVFCTQDRNFRCMFLPKNTTSVIQPLNQGIILATKRLYRKRFLEEVMAVFKEETDKSKGTEEQNTLQNLRNYNLKSAIFNIAAAWKAVSREILENGWNKLLNNVDTSLQIEGCEVSDFHKTIRNAGEKEVTADTILKWLKEDENDPGYQVMTEKEIAEEAMACDKADEENKEEWSSVCKIELSDLRSHLNDLITFIDSSSDPEVQPYYTHFQAFREIIIRKQQTSKSQMKLDAFFKPVNQTKPVLPQPSTSLANGVNLDLPFLT